MRLTQVVPRAYFKQCFLELLSFNNLTVFFSCINNANPGSLEEEKDDEEASGLRPELAVEQCLVSSQTLYNTKFIDWIEPLFSVQR